MILVPIPGKSKHWMAVAGGAIALAFAPGLFGATFLWDDLPLIQRNALLHALGKPAPPAPPIVLDGLRRRVPGIEPLLPTVGHPGPRAGVASLRRPGGALPRAEPPSPSCEFLAGLLLDSAGGSRFGDSSRARLSAIAAVAALAFALHPTRPESVTFISGDPDLWAALWGLLGVEAFGSPRRGGLLLPAGLFLLSAASKEAGLLFPILLYADVSTQPARPRRAEARFLGVGAVLLGLLRTQLFPLPASGPGETLASHAVLVVRSIPGPPIRRSSGRGPSPCSPGPRRSAREPGRRSWVAVGCSSPCWSPSDRCRAAPGQSCWVRRRGRLCRSSRWSTWCRSTWRASSPIATLDLPMIGLAVGAQLACSALNDGQRSRLFLARASGLLLLGLSGATAVRASELQTAGVGVATRSGGSPDDRHAPAKPGDHPLRRGPPGGGAGGAAPGPGRRPGSRRSPGYGRGLGRRSAAHRSGLRAGDAGPPLPILQRGLEAIGTHGAPGGRRRRHRCSAAGAGAIHLAATARFRNNASVAHARALDFPRAEAELQLLVGDRPGDGDAWFNLAMVQALQSRWSAAERSADRAIAASPRDERLVGFRRLLHDGSGLDTVADVSQRERARAAIFQTLGSPRAALGVLDAARHTMPGIAPWWRRRSNSWASSRGGAMRRTW